jgi:hypothetical protein
MDGRVLAEALKNSGKVKTEAQTIEATKKFPGGTWQQRLTILRVGSTIYLEEGKGSFKPQQ